MHDSDKYSDDALYLPFLKSVRIVHGIKSKAAFFVTSPSITVADSPLPARSIVDLWPLSQEDISCLPL